MCRYHSLFCYNVLSDIKYYCQPEGGTAVRWKRSNSQYPGYIKKMISWGRCHLKPMLMWTESHPQSKSLPVPWMHDGSVKHDVVQCCRVCLALSPYSKKVLGSIPTLTLHCLVLRWTNSLAFLCGVYMSSPCSHGFPLQRMPIETHAEQIISPMTLAGTWISTWTWPTVPLIRLNTIPSCLWRKEL